MQGWCSIQKSVRVIHACSVAQLCLTLGNPMDCTLPSSFVHGILQNLKNTGVGCHFLLQGIFLTQGSNPCLLCLLHWQADSSPLSHLGPSHKKLKKKNHMIISIDTKTFENIQHSFMIKTLRKLGIEKFLNLMKNIYQKTYRQHHT